MDPMRGKGIIETGEGMISPRGEGEHSMDVRFPVEELIVDPRARFLKEEWSYVVPQPTIRERFLRWLAKFMRPW